LEFSQNGPFMQHAWMNEGPCPDCGLLEETAKSPLGSAAWGLSWLRLGEPLGQGQQGTAACLSGQLGFLCCLYCFSWAPWPSVPVPYFGSFLSSQIIHSGPLLILGDFTLKKNQTIVFLPVSWPQQILKKQTLLWTSCVSVKTNKPTIKQSTLFLHLDHFRWKSRGWVYLVLKCQISAFRVTCKWLLDVFKYMLISANP
jgi:hypothetical protein